MPYVDRDKRRQSDREWRAARRAAWIAENGPCQVCGTWDNLEIDHIDPATKARECATGGIWGWSEERRSAELAKCQVLCHDHHLDKTWPNRHQHGTKRRYTNGCRCPECTEAMTAYHREWRRRRRAAAN